MNICVTDHANIKELTLPMKKLQGVFSFDSFWIRSFSPSSPPTYSFPEMSSTYSHTAQILTSKSLFGTRVCPGFGSGGAPVFEKNYLQKKL